MSYDTALSALADPTRRAVFEAVRHRERAVGEVAAGLPVSRPAVSQHLRVLEDAGLVRVRRAGARRLYAADPAGLEDLRAWLDGFWDEALDSFRRAAER